MFAMPDPAVIVPLLFVIGVLPILLVMLTCYTKIVVVLALLKSAMGLQQVPPAMVTNGLALVLTWYVMYPVGQQIMASMDAEPQNPRAVARLTVPDMVGHAKEPMRNFLDRHARANERAFFMDGARRLMGEKVAQGIGPKDFVVLVPAFVVSELTAAFLIGVLIALPLIVIDLVVANVLMALGMQMMSPTMISLPLKLLLFVMVDGWSRLTHALVLTYQ
ncbi:MAG: type III secretion system export apparatus subunit SctR [Rubrivivax sp.]|nr:type III secretion system export apparatus subunit SctR [Rubrivivax sp.]